MFEGVSVALVTPFSGGEVDETAFRGLIGHVLDQGVAGLVATGSTGETPTLSVAERRRLWTIAREEARGKAFVVAGTGSNSTRETIELTRLAAEDGVDGCMIVAPYYNKPTQKGLIAHFRTVAEAVPIPLLLYNVPGRTGVNVLPETVAAVASHRNVVAVKEASGSVEQASAVRHLTDLTVLSGDDGLTLPMMAAGASGVVSVAGHLIGKPMVEMVEHHRAGRVEAAADIHRRVLPLVQALFLESNPAPLKAALAHLGLIENELRLPLVPVEPQTEARVVGEMERLGLIPSGISKG